MFVIHDPDLYGAQVIPRLLKSCVAMGAVPGIDARYRASVAGPPYFVQGDGAFWKISQIVLCKVLSSWNTSVVFFLLLSEHVRNTCVKDPRQRWMQQWDLIGLCET